MSLGCRLLDFVDVQNVHMRNRCSLPTNEINIINFDVIFHNKLRYCSGISKTFEKLRWIDVKSQEDTPHVFRIKTSIRKS